MIRGNRVVAGCYMCFSGAGTVCGWVVSCRNRPNCMLLIGLMRVLQPVLVGCIGGISSPRLGQLGHSAGFGKIQSKGEHAGPAPPQVPAIATCQMLYLAFPVSDGGTMRTTGSVNCNMVPAPSSARYSSAASVQLARWLTAPKSLRTPNAVGMVSHGASDIGCN